MADYGTVQLAPLPPSPLGAVVFAAVSMVGYNLGDVKLTPLPPPPTKAVTPGSYGVAGTQDTAYRPPTRGQLYPRGDLDAS